MAANWPKMGQGPSKAAARPLQDRPKIGAGQPRSTSSRIKTPQDRLKTVVKQPQDRSKTLKCVLSSPSTPQDGLKTPLDGLME